MVDSYSPQPCAVGEDVKNTTENRSSIGIKPTYASLLAGKQSADSSLKHELCPVSIENGTPCVEFTVDEVNSFTREEELHQAFVIKFSYGKPALHELRQILPKQFDVKGICNIGQLEFRHILVRFDLFEDFAHVVSKTSGYIQSKGDDFFFRTFPWTMGFNPREETSKAVVWISFPDLPANFFARKSLMSIASAVGKPLSVDKATKDRTCPSTARVKVLIDLLDKLPKKIKIKILDIKSGKIVEYDQQIVFDNLPKYCTYCNHQGHDVKACRWNTEDLNRKTVHVSESEGRDRLVKSGRDIREFLNEKKASRDESALQNVTAPNANVGVSLPSISADSIELCKKLSFGTLKVPMDVITENEITLVNKQQRVQDSVVLKTDAIGASVDHISVNNLASSSEQQFEAGLQSGGEADNKFDHNLVEEINPVSTGIASKSFGSVPEANLFTNGQIDATDEQNAGLKEDVITSVSVLLHSAMQNTAHNNIPMEHSGQRLDLQQQIFRCNLPQKDVSDCAQHTSNDESSQRDTTNAKSKKVAQNLDIEQQTLHTHHNGTVSGKATGDSMDNLSLLKSIADPNVVTSDSVVKLTDNLDSSDGITGNVFAEFPGAVQVDHTPDSDQVDQHTTKSFGPGLNSQQLVPNMDIAADENNMSDELLCEQQLLFRTPVHIGEKSKELKQMDVSKISAGSSKLGRTSGIADDNVCNNTVPQTTSDVEFSDNQQEGKWLARDTKAVNSKSKKKSQRAENKTEVPSANSFDILINVNDDERKILDESRQNCDSQFSSKNSETKNKSHDTNLQKQAKPQTSLTTATKMWKDQRDYDDEETWGEGLAEFSWEEEECATSDDSDVSVEQKVQRKNASKNSRTSSRHNPTPNSILNHNAPVFVPRNKSDTVSQDGQHVKTGEGVNIRRLPMRNAKKQQVSQIIPSKSSRSKNKS